MKILGFSNRGLFRMLEQALPNLNQAANYSLVLCAKQNENNINNAAAVDKGSGKVGIPVTTHGYTAGEAVKILSTINYDGYYIVQSGTTANEVVIVATYAAETFAGTETIHEAPGEKTNILTDLTEIAAGNGYTAGGQEVERNISAGFDSLTEDDSGNQAKIRLQDRAWTAGGGSMPSSGDGARYPVLIDDSDNVICFWDLETDVTVSAGQSLVIQNAEFVTKSQG